MLRPGLIPALAAGVPLVTALLVAVLLSANEYRALRYTSELDPLSGLQQLQHSPLWAGHAGRALARRLDARWRVNPNQAQALLQQQLSHYPLDPWHWQLLARIDRELGADTAHLQQRLNAAAAIQPGHRELRWVAVNLSQHFGDVNLVSQQLKHWLEDQPSRTASALFIANRWIDEPDQQIDQVLPEGEAYLVAAMRHARSTRNTALADAVWRRLPQPRLVNDPAVGDYARMLLSRGDHSVARNLLAQLDPSFARHGVPGGQFQFDLQGLSTLGWDFRAPQGLRIRIVDDTLPPTSMITASDQLADIRALQLDFDGDHNLNFSRPVVRFPAPEPGHYQLQGWWRAQGLTTRSLPRLQLRAQHSPLRGQIDLPSRNFGWQPFTIDFEITNPEDTLTFQVVRRSTQAFDRNLAGQLRLTDLRLQRVEPTPANTVNNGAKQ